MDLVIGYHIGGTCFYLFNTIKKRMKYNKLKNITTYNEIRNNRYGYFKNIELQSISCNLVHKNSKIYEVVIDPIDNFIVKFALPSKFKCNFIADVKNNKINICELKDPDTLIKDVKEEYVRYMFSSFIYGFITIGMFVLRRYIEKV